MADPLQPVDVHNNPISVGSRVQILEIPAWLVHDLPEQEVLRLRKCEGQVMKILEVDQFGYVWFGANDEGRWFCLRPHEVLSVKKLIGAKTAGTRCSQPA